MTGLTDPVIDSTTADSTTADSTTADSKTDLIELFHLLNNQLGIILANAELLEHRLVEETHRARAGQVVASTVEAISTSQQIRHAALAASPR